MDKGCVRGHGRRGEALCAADQPAFWVERPHMDADLSMKSQVCAL